MSIAGLYQKDKACVKQYFIFLVVYLVDKFTEDAGMKREDIRRENSRKLSARAGGKTEFGRMLEMDGSQVSQIIGPNPTKNIGNSIAMRIENAFDYPSGWLDVEHPELTVDGTEQRREIDITPEPFMLEVAKPAPAEVEDGKLERLNDDELAWVWALRECSPPEREMLLNQAERTLGPKVARHFLFRRHKP